MRKISLFSMLALPLLTLSPLCGGAAETQTILGLSEETECAAAAATAERSGQAGESGLQACNHAIASDLPTLSDRASAFLNRGVILLTRGDSGAAIRDFDQALKLKPTFAAALNDRGMAHYALHHYGLAISDYTAALASGPARPERVLFNRALAYEDQQDLRLAYLDYRQAAELNPAWDQPAHELARFTVTRTPAS